MARKWWDTMSSFSPLVGRSLEDTPIDYSRRFTPQQGLILQCLAAVSATISILAAFVAFYWFFRMRKKFRHV